MAQRTEVVLTCDVHDGVADAVATVALALDGDAFDCDLCAVHLAELRRTFERWSSHARPVGAPDDTAASRRSRRLSTSGGRSATDSRRARRKVKQPPRVATVRRAQRVPVQPRAVERRERMLAASEEIFAEMGYAATNTNLIANRADTSVGSVYNFLGSKEAIAIALFERYLAELEPRYDDVVRSSDGVHVLVDLVDEFLKGHPALRPLLRNRWGSDELRAARRRFQISLAIPIERLIARQREFADPIRRRVVAEMCAGVIWTMVDEVTELPRRRQPARLAELKLLLAGYVVAGVAAA
jgi:AcrR family transcriptional regulator